MGRLVCVVILHRHPEVFWRSTASPCSRSQPQIKGTLLLHTCWPPSSSSRPLERGHTREKILDFSDKRSGVSGSLSVRSLRFYTPLMRSLFHIRPHVFHFEGVRPKSVAYASNLEFMRPSLSRAAGVI
eukprot:2481725-Pyramimonas_sp.AAC.1